MKRKAKVSSKNLIKKVIEKVLEGFESPLPHIFESDVCNTASLFLFISAENDACYDPSQDVFRRAFIHSVTAPFTQ